MKVALIHDWLTGTRGGEKVLEALCDLYPEAPIYTLVHVSGSVSEKIESHPIFTSWIQHAPMVRHFYRNYLPFFPSAIESFDLSSYDLIVSSSHCVAKGVIPGKHAAHVCYCHTPMRYIWSHYDDYFGDHRTGFPKRQILPRVAKSLRTWDVRASDRVDVFVANSQNVAERIQRFYGREAQVIYPPVDVDYYVPVEVDRQDFYLMVSALVPYKRLELAIEAFQHNPKRLVIVGTGPEEKRLRKLAGSNVEFSGRVSAEKLRELLQTARALIHPGEEDFGLNMVEALACGCPVIAFAAGGALEIVTDRETGLFFNELTPISLLAAVDIAATFSFNETSMRNTALRFSFDHFRNGILDVIRTHLFDHAARQK